MSNFNELQSEFENGEFWNFIGFEMVNIDKGRATIKIELREDILNMQRMLHGGIIMSGLDMVMGLCARTTGAEKVATIQLETRFLHSLYDGYAILESEIIHRNKNIVTLKGIVKGSKDNEKLIAYSTSTFKLTF